MDHDADTIPIDRDHAVAELLTFFDHDHLPPDLAEVARPFGAAARALAAGNSDLALGLARHSLPGREGVAMVTKLSLMLDAIQAGYRSDGVRSALRFILEAKDCAVRAVLVLRRERPKLLDSLAGAEACTTILAGPGRMADLETIGAVEPGATVDPIGHMVGRLTERGRWLARIASAPPKTMLTYEGLASMRAKQRIADLRGLVERMEAAAARMEAAAGSAGKSTADRLSELRRLQRPIPGERLGLGPDSGDFIVTSVSRGEHPALTITAHPIESSCTIPPDLLKSDKPSGLNG